MGAAYEVLGDPDARVRLGSLLVFAQKCFLRTESPATKHLVIPCYNPAITAISLFISGATVTAKHFCAQHASVRETPTAVARYDKETGRAQDASLYTEEASIALTMDAKQFQAMHPKATHIVDFYAPWCGH